MKLRSMIILLPALALIAGCRTATIPQGLDRAAQSARAAIEQKYPDVPGSDLRLLSIIPLSHAIAANRLYMVIFEQVSSIRAITTREGVRTRSARHLDAHVAADGTVISVGESRHNSSRGPSR